MNYQITNKDIVNKSFILEYIKEKLGIYKLINRINSIYVR